MELAQQLDHDRERILLALEVLIDLRNQITYYGSADGAVQKSIRRKIKSQLSLFVDATKTVRLCTNDAITRISTEEILSKNKHAIQTQQIVGAMLKKRDENEILLNNLIMLLNAETLQSDVILTKLNGIALGEQQLLKELDKAIVLVKTLPSQKKQNYLVVDFTPVLSSTSHPYVILDADFTTKIDAYKKELHKSGFTFVMPERLHMPKQVFQELTYHPLWGVGRALVSDTMISYLNKINVDIVQVTPNEDELSFIASCWRVNTNQGKKRDNMSEDKFYQSGDVAILTLAWRQAANAQVIILSNNISEIGAIAEKINLKYGTNIKVIPSQNAIKIAA